VAKIEEMMKQELPQLVDERRFRRRDQEQERVERDEFGRVSVRFLVSGVSNTLKSVSGLKSVSPLASSLFLASTYEPRLLVMAAHTSSTSNRRLAVECRSRAGVLVTLRRRQAKRAKMTCFYM